MLQKNSPGPAFRTRQKYPQEPSEKRKMTNVEMSKFIQIMRSADVLRDWSKIFHEMQGAFAVSQLKNAWHHYLRKLRDKRARM